MGLNKVPTLTHHEVPLTSYFHSKGEIELIRQVYCHLAFETLKEQYPKFKEYFKRVNLDIGHPYKNLLSEPNREIVLPIQRKNENSYKDLRAIFDENIVAFPFNPRGRSKRRKKNKK